MPQVLDAVVTDPPYGVRAGGRKGRARPDARVPDRSVHHAALEPYTFGVQNPLSALRASLPWNYMSACRGHLKFAGQQMALEPFLSQTCIL